VSERQEDVGDESGLFLHFEDAGANVLGQVLELRDGIAADGMRCHANESISREQTIPGRDQREIAQDRRRSAQLQPHSKVAVSGRLTMRSTAVEQDERLGAAEAGTARIFLQINRGHHKTTPANAEAAPGFEICATCCSAGQELPCGPVKRSYASAPASYFKNAPNLHATGSPTVTLRLLFMETYLQEGLKWIVGRTWRVALTL
jgi:hypothetical protein